MLMIILIFSLQFSEVLESNLMSNKLVFLLRSLVKITFPGAHGG